MKPVAIIGGGVTGLTAAYRLTQKGIPVTLFEASDRVGGVIRSVRQDGYLAEFGPNTILETSPKIGQLIRDLGLEPRRWYSDPNAENRYIVRGARPVALPTSFVGFLRTPLFSARAKLRLMAEPFIRRAPAEREESLAEFVVRRIGREFLDYAINPFVAGVYAGNPARLSVKHAFPKLHALEQRYGSLIRGQILGARERKRRGEVSKQDAKKVSFDEGLQVLTDTLGRELGDRLKLRAPVASIRAENGDWRVRVEGGSEESFGAVLLAVPAYKIATIAFEHPQGLDWTPLGEMVYPPVASIVLGFRRADVDHPLDGFGMLIPEVEGFRILGALFSSSLFPNRAPEGHVTLTSYIGGARAPELATRPHAELVQMTYEDLRRILGIRGRPTFEHTYFYPKAIPQYEVGFGRFKDLMDRIEQQAPGIFFAGHYRNGIALSDSICSGLDVAERIEGFVHRSPAEAADRQTAASHPTP